MNEQITLTSDLKPFASQPDGPWQAGAGGYSHNMYIHIYVYAESQADKSDGLNAQFDT